MKRTITDIDLNLKNKKKKVEEIIQVESVKEVNPFKIGTKLWLDWDVNNPKSESDIYLNLKNKMESVGEVNPFKNNPFKIGTKLWLNWLVYNPKFEPDILETTRFVLNLNTINPIFCGPGAFVSSGSKPKIPVSAVPPNVSGLISDDVIPSWLDSWLDNF
jgi:hypothetical protein